MERNTVTTISELHPGDRFYKAGDAKKKLFTLVHGEIKVTKWQTYSHFGIEDKALFPVAFKKDTQVIYLRNKEEKL